MTRGWRVYGEDTLVGRLGRAEIPGFLRKKIAVGPGEVALVAKEGEAFRTITEASQKVRGFWEGLAKLFGSNPELDVYFISIAPFDLRWVAGRQSGGGFETRLISADAEEVMVEVVARAHVRQKDVAKAVGLLKGRHAVSRTDLIDPLRSRLLGEVLVPEVQKYRSDELVARQGGILRQARIRLSEYLDEWGIELTDISMSWALTESQRVDMVKRRQALEEELLAVNHRAKIQELDREVELEEIRLANLREIREAKIKGDQEIEKLLLLGEAEKDEILREKAMKEVELNNLIQELELKAALRRQEVLLLQGRRKEEQAIELERLRLQAAKEVRDFEFECREREARRRIEELEEKVRVETAEMQQLLNMKLLKDEKKHLRQLEDKRQVFDHEMELRKLDLDRELRLAQVKLDETLAYLKTMSSLMGQAIQSGTANAEVLKIMWGEVTKMLYASASDGKVRALFEAKMAESFTNTADGSGNAPGAGSFARSGDNHAATIPRKPGDAPGGRDSGLTCPGCRTPVEPDWKRCPRCGESLSGERRFCPNCGRPLQAGWKTCPYC